MNKPNEPKSNTPLLIIGGVLIAAGLGAWYMFSTAKTPPPANNSQANIANRTKQPQVPTNAPPGAQPPNQAGSPTAAVTLEEFADFQCGSCAAAHPTMNEIKSIYGSRIRFVFRNFPLAIPAHDKAYEAAVAAEAAGVQGKFWDMQNLLFTNQQVWTLAPTYKEIWKSYAEKIGLDVARWETDRIGLAAKGRVDEDIKRGKALGVSSTPSLYVNNVPVQFGEMTVAALKALIDAELQKAAPQTAAPATAGNQNK
jgi:protein-disulfide isomerase